jgi:hypothetical protein
MRSLLLSARRVGGHYAPLRALLATPLHSARSDWYPSAGADTSAGNVLLRGDTTIVFGGHHRQNRRTRPIRPPSYKRRPLRGRAIGQNRQNHKRYRLMNRRCQFLPSIQILTGASQRLVVRDRGVRGGTARSHCAIACMHRARERNRSVPL